MFFYNRNESMLNLLELHNDSFFILKLLYSQSNLCCIIFQLSMWSCFETICIV